MLPLILGTMAFQAWSGYQQAQSIRDTAELQSRVDEMNAKYQEIDAYNAEKFGYTQAARQETKDQGTLADQKAAMAAKGIDVSRGSAVDIQQQSKTASVLNTVDIESQARAKALGLKWQAGNTRLGSNMHMIQANMDATTAQRQGIISAGITGISGYTRDRVKPTNHEDDLIDRNSDAYSSTAGE